MAVRLHLHVYALLAAYIFHHKLLRLLFFYQLNVSNKVNLCAFKYMQNVNFFFFSTNHQRYSAEWRTNTYHDAVAMAMAMDVLLYARAKEMKYHIELKQRCLICIIFKMGEF